MGGMSWGWQKYGGVEWPVSMPHYIRHHGLKPTDKQQQAIESKYDELYAKERVSVEAGMKWKMAAESGK
jgi:hypothetical protein